MAVMWVVLTALRWVVQSVVSSANMTAATWAANWVAMLVALMVQQKAPLLVDLMAIGTVEMKERSSVVLLAAQMAPMRVDRLVD